MTSLAWEDGPEAGGWIAGLLGPFGPTVAGAVPRGHPAHAIVPVPRPDDDTPEDPGHVPTLEALVGVLAPVTGHQQVHCAIWEGWSWWYPHGTDPRTAPGMGAGVLWSGDGEPTQEERERALAQAREAMAAECMEAPDVRRLDLPYRAYYVWRGPLESITAFRDYPPNPPSLIWPEDRSWFVGIPIYSEDIAVAGSDALVDAVCAALPAARRAAPGDVLDIDD
ncbi:hypothetical protein [Conexibacter woesei]|uniref:hypothetical protein n=1 Tax=Conexibacter woesei TaxID=191495 RepID=UPI000423F4CB|nr:hypothetical protein [Conexibacter woesei]